MFHSPFAAIRQHTYFDFISASFNLFYLLLLCLFSYCMPHFQAHNTLMCFRSQVLYFARFFVHRLAQIACKLFLVFAWLVTLLLSKLVNFCSRRCQNSRFLIIIPQRSSEYAKTLIFCEKQPLLHTNLESYAKVLRIEKPTGFAGRRFRAFQCPKIIPLYPALKSTA